MQDEARTDPPATATQDRALARRRLLFHDSLTFFILILITVALFTVTFFLFRSFAAHRAHLATRWADRGTAALAAGKPADAVIDLRTALTYDPGQRTNQLLFAQALGAAGRTEEAINYFLNLWDLTPGDGFINLQLARLAQQTRNQDDAVHYYRAAIFGSWQDDAIERRRAVRFELLHYLIAQHDLATARTELLIAASNTPATPEADMEIAHEFLAIADPPTALTWYQKAISEDPHDPEALDGAGRLAAQLDDANGAIEYLQRALEAQPRRKRNGESKLTDEQRIADEALLTQLQQTAAAQTKSSKAKHRS